jgi:hypothetical protein
MAAEQDRQPGKDEQHPDCQACPGQGMGQLARPLRDRRPNRREHEHETGGRDRTDQQRSRHRVSTTADAVFAADTPRQVGG